MAYAQTTDLEARLGSDLLVQLADEDGDGSADVSILTAALDDAAAEIDATLSGRYVTPISPAPAVLVRLSAELAIYYLFLRRRSAITGEHLERWRSARNYLQQIAGGRLELPEAAARLKGFQSESTTRDQDKLFDRDALDSF